MNPNSLIFAIKGALFAALLAPFMVNMNFYYPFVGPKGLYFMACAELAFFLWVILAWRWTQFRPNFKNPLLISIFIFLGVLFVSGIFGADFSSSFWSKFERMSGILMFCHLVAYAMVASSVLNRRDWLWMFGSSAGMAVIIGVNALYNVQDNARGGGFIGNDSFLGTYLLFNAFFALYLVISQDRQEKKFLKIFGAVAFAILSFCLVLEGTQFCSQVVSMGVPYYYPAGFFNDLLAHGARAAKISLAGGLVLLAILRLLVSGKKMVRKITIAGLGIILALGILGSTMVFQKDNTAYMAAISNFGESTIGSRLVVWRIAWEGFMDRPYLGWGPENFALAFAKHFNPCLGSDRCGGDIWYDRAHNIVLDTLVETGFVGLVAYILLSAAAIFTLWKAYLLKRADFAAAGVFTALFAAYFVQNLTVFDMITSYLMFFFSLAFIMSYARPENVDQKSDPASATVLRFLIPAIFGVLCFIFFVINPMVADQGVISAVREPYESPAKIDAYRNTLEVSPMGKYQVRLFFSGQWIATLRSGYATTKITKEQAQNIFDFLSEELIKSCRESPNDFQSYLGLGRLYSSWSLIDKAKLPMAASVLEKTIALWPDNQQPYMELSQVYFYEGRTQDALSTANHAVSLDPGNEQAKASLNLIERYVEMLEKGAK